MLIIKLIPEEIGVHLYQDNVAKIEGWEDESWKEVPEQFIEIVLSSKGYCELTIENNEIVNVVKTSQAPFDIDEFILGFSENSLLGVYNV